MVLAMRSAIALLLACLSATTNSEELTTEEATAAATAAIDTNADINTPPPSWQYFCFESANQFAAVANKAIFTILPEIDPGGGQKPSTPEPSEEPADRKVQQYPEPEEQTQSWTEKSDVPGEVAADASEVADADEDELTVAAAVAKLASLRGTCYFMRQGYWTYEACPFVSVRQYHSESGGARGTTVHAEFSLGKHATDRDVILEQAIYQQDYTGGTEGRMSQVQFSCPDSWRDEDGITSVTEPTTQQYLITLRVQALCPATGSKLAMKAERTRRETVAARNRREMLKLKKQEEEEKAAGGGGAAAAKAAGAGGGGGGGAAPAPPSTMQIAEMVLPNMRLLSSLRGRCFSMTVDYWTYEFCPQQHVRQFRQEGRKVSTEFSLGVYDRTNDKLTLGVRGKLDSTFVPHAFSQLYDHGTGNRKTTVSAAAHACECIVMLSLSDLSLSLSLLFSLLLTGTRQVRR